MKNNYCLFPKNIFGLSLITVLINKTFFVFVFCFLSSFFFFFLFYFILFFFFYFFLFYFIFFFFFLFCFCFCFFFFFLEYSRKDRQLFVVVHFANFLSKCKSKDCCKCRDHNRCYNQDNLVECNNLQSNHSHMNNILLTSKTLHFGKDTRPSKNNSNCYNLFHVSHNKMEKYKYHLDNQNLIFFSFSFFLFLL